MFSQQVQWQEQLLRMAIFCEVPARSKTATPSDTIAERQSCNIVRLVHHCKTIRQDCRAAGGLRLWDSREQTAAADSTQFGLSQPTSSPFFLFQCHPELLHGPLLENSLSLSAAAESETHGPILVRPAEQQMGPYPHVHWQAVRCQGCQGC